MMAVDGVYPRAYNSLQVDLGSDLLSAIGAAENARKMALFIMLSSRKAAKNRLGFGQPVPSLYREHDRETRNDQH